MLGPSVVFTNDLTPRCEYKKENKLFKETIIKTGSSIGANSTIICGVTLGQYCFVGAGSVVTKDVLPHSLVFGSPAVHVDFVCFCCETRKSKKNNCDICGFDFDSLLPSP